MAAVRVVSMLPFAAADRARLAAVSPALAIEHRDGDAAELDDPDAEVLLARVLPRDPARLPRLRWVQLAGVGLDALPGLDAWRGRDVAVSNAAGAYTVPIAEYAIGALLAGAQRLPERLALQRDRRWGSPAQAAGRVLRDRTLAVLGYGSIGREVARLARALGMRVIAVKRRPEVLLDERFREPGTGDPTGTLPDRVAGLDELEAVAAEADHLVVAVPLTAQTHRIVGRPVLAALGPEAWLVNVGRGAVVCESALVDALRRGELGGAVLDVFATEPLPPASPLWGLPRAIVTPHVAGLGERWPAVADLAVENLDRYASGRPPRNLVDLVAGY